jgi:hypothetical protein
MFLTQDRIPQKSKEQNRKKNVRECNRFNSLILFFYRYSLVTIHCSLLVVTKFCMLAVRFFINHFLKIFSKIRHPHSFIFVFGFR